MPKDLDYVIRDSNEKETSDSERVLSQSLQFLVEQFAKSKNFSKRQIKAMSLLRTNSIFAEIIDDWIENMKHNKGKFRKECKQLIKNGFEGISNIIKTEKEGLLHNAINRIR